MKLVCDIITPAIERLAEKFGLSKEVTCTMVSVWKSMNNTSEYPTSEQFRKYMKDNEKELESLELAVPTYETHEFEEGKSLTWHENGTIHMMKLPKDNPLEYFFGKYGDEFRKYVRTTEEAYQVMLWNEMWYVQNSVEHTENNNKAVESALNKAKNYNKQNPLNISTYTQEMIDIKNKAIADGTFMKAPNGKPTNLNERQWLQVRTKAFKEWFGDWENDSKNASKVVDENGEPLVVYHGTSNVFNTFKIGKDLGFHFGTLEAANYRKKEGSNIIPVFLNIRNKRNSDDILLWNLNNLANKGFITKQEAIDIENEAIKYAEQIKNSDIPFYAIKNNYINDYIYNKFNNYFGIEYINKVEDKTSVSYIVFNPNQIKSATDNNGEFSRADNSILANQSVKTVHPALNRIEKFKDTVSESKKHAKNLSEIGTVLNRLLDAMPKYIETKSVFGEISRTGINTFFTRSSKSGRYIMSRGSVVNREELADKTTMYHPDVIRRECDNMFNIAKQMGYIDTYKKLSYVPFRTEKGEFTEVILEDMTQEEKDYYDFEQASIIANELAEKYEKENAWNVNKSSDSKLLDKFGGKQVITINECLDNLLKSNSPYKGLINILKDIVGEVGNVQIQLIPTHVLINNTDDESCAYYSPSENKIYIGSQSAFPKGPVDGTLLHEILHAVIANTDKTEEQVQQLNKIYEDAVSMVEKRYSKTKEEILNDEQLKPIFYGLTNVDEFVSELFTNSSFMKELNKIDEYNKAAGDKQMSIFDRFVQWIMSFFKTKSQLFQDAVSTVNDILMNNNGKISSERRTLSGIVKNLSNQTGINNPKEFELHSGGAYGADYEWGEIGKEFGVTKQHHYRVKNSEKQPKFSNEDISDEDYDKGRYKAARAAEYNFGYQYKTMKDPLLIRNWAQVNHADAVFAIGHIANEGEKLFPNIPGDTRTAVHQAVQGGTGYAVTMAIRENKPVYVFDQERKNWYTYTEQEGFIATETPVLTKNFAGIGSRGITAAGKKAIRDVYEKTFGNLQQEVPQLSIDELLPKVTPENTTYDTEDLDTFTDDGQYDDVGIEDFSMESFEEADKAAQKKSVTVEQANNVENMPKPGPKTGYLTITENAELRKLYADYDIRTLNHRVEYLTTRFRDRLMWAIDKELEKLTTQLSNTNDEFEKKAITDKINRLQSGDIKSAIEILKFGNVLNLVKKEIQDSVAMLERNGDKDSYKHNELVKMLENFNQLKIRVRRLIDSYYNIRINQNDDVIESDDDADLTEEQYGDATEGERVNEIIGAKSRVTNPFSTLSKKMKFALSNIVMVDSDGNIIRDDLGNLRYYDPSRIYRMILSESEKIKSSDEFSVRTGKGPFDIDIIFLEQLKKKYPWAEQLENLFYDSADMASLFYSAFRLDFIHYGTQVVVDGKFVSTYENSRPAVEGIYSRILDDYNYGHVNSGSVFTTEGYIDSENVAQAVELSSELSSKERKDEYDNEYIDGLIDLLKRVGVNTGRYVVKQLVDNEDDTLHENAREVTGTISNILSRLSKAVEKVKNEKYHVIDENSADYKTLAQKLGTIEEDDNVASFTDSERKQRYSYSTPNFCGTLIKHVTDTNDNARQKYIDEHFKKYEWFYNKDTKQWRNGWLEAIEKDPYIRSTMKVYDMVSMDRKPYKDWTPDMMKEGFIREFYKGGWNGKSQLRSFHMPIFADSEVVTFIDFEDVVGVDNVCRKFVDVVKQELYRMRLIEDRNKNNASKITNFDKRGKKFCFLPQLNSLKVDNEGNIDENGSNFLDVCLSKSVTERDNFIFNVIKNLKAREFNDYMNRNFRVIEVNNSGEVVSFVGQGLAGWMVQNEMMENIDYNSFRNLVEHWWYNQEYATSQIVQLYTVDYAFYKNDDDFQKRWKEIYASGYKPNTNSQYGKKVRKTVYIADDERTSTIYDEIKSVLDKAVREGRIQSYDRYNILYKFRNINVADAQCFLSLKSMRSILDMVGQWGNEMEDSFNRFEEGNWDMSDFYTVWQTLKPFMYTVTETPDGLGNTIPVPHQNKNSEFLLLAGYTMIANSLKNNPKMVAMQKYMDDNDIDAIQFESAVKAGKQGVININYSRRKLKEYISNEKQWNKIESKVLGYLTELYGSKKGSDMLKDMPDYDKYKTYYDILLNDGGISQEAYNEAINNMEPDTDEVYEILDTESKIQSEEAEKASKGVFGFDSEGNPRKVNDFKQNVVHELSYEDYMIQQPTPNHLFDNDEAVYGSQMRNLAISDMPDDPNFVVYIDGKPYKKQEVLNLWNSIQIENLLEDYREVEGKMKTIEDFSEELKKMVRSNGKYSADLEYALNIVTNPDGSKRFEIPLTNPVTATKLQQLALSLFKNRITKQKIRGGGAILVSDVGFTDELKIRRDKRGGIIGYESYLPATSEKFLKPFIKKSADGSYMYLDINSMPKELRYAIGYRIPTEDKYSISVLIIKGFLPQQNGSSIMLPMEITTIAGSDFDIDKMFLLLYEFGERKYDKRKAKEDFKKENALTESLKKIFANETVDLDAVTDIEWKDWWKENKSKYLLEKPEIYKIKYDFGDDKNPKSAKDNNRQQRNNMLIDIMRGVLSHPHMAHMIFNPGNYDSLKCNAKVLQIARDKELLETFMSKYNVNSIEGISRKMLELMRQGKLDEIEDFLKEHQKVIDPLSTETFIYYHQQNMTGGKLIGVYANNTTLHAKFQRTGLRINNTENTENTFIINNRKIDSLHDINIVPSEGKSIRISKNCSEFSAASVDNVKDPVLDKLLQNGNTAEITCFMLRAGLTLEEVSLLATAPVMKMLYDGWKEDDIKNYVLLLQSKYAEAGGDFIPKVTEYKYTSENILNAYLSRTIGLETKESIEADLMVSKLMLHIINLAKPFANVTKTGRADSPNGAIAHSFGRALVQKEAVRRLGIDDNFQLAGMDSGVKNGVITTEMSDESMRKNLSARPIAHLQSFYSFGIELPLELLSKYFPQLSQKAVSMVRDILAEMNTLQLYSDKSISVIDKFFDALTIYSMSGTQTFGNDDKMTYLEKVDWYVNEFPNWFEKFKSEHPELFERGLFSKMQKKNGKIIVVNASNLDQSIRDTYISDMDMLLANPEYNEFAEHLFRYSYYTEGLRFGPTSIGQFFSSYFMSGFREVVNSMNWTDNNMTDADRERFNDLFVINNKLAKKVNIPDSEDKSNPNIYITGKKESERFHIKTQFVANKYGITNKVLKYIYVVEENKGIMLKLDSYVSGSQYATYKRVEGVGGPYSVYNKDAEFLDKYDKIINKNNGFEDAFDGTFFDDFDDTGIEDYDNIPYPDSIGEQPDYSKDGKNNDNEKEC